MADAPRCVYCRERPIDSRHRPFCSERCRMADLGRWLRGDYRVSGIRASARPEALTADGTSGADGAETTDD